MADLDDSQPKKKGKLKWILLIIILLLLLGGGAAAYWYFFMNKGAPTDATANATEQTASSKENVKSEIVTLQTFLVNLADPLGRRYVKMTLDVEVTDAKAAEQLNNNAPKVRDAVILLLSSKTYADLAPLENKIILKNEIVERLNQILGGPKVLRVYFTELVVQ